MAGGAGTRSRQACDVAGAFDARRQGLRLQLGNADDGHGSVCAAYRAAFCDRHEEAWAQPDARRAGHFEIPAAGAKGRSALAVFVTAASDEIRKLTGKRFGLMGYS